ncbi:MAG: ABC transporter permease subunit [Candidatus Sabulitectum sp.]|nr:ABC transporter permease subunit [Candidatus Sabulitectum sp.]
MKTVFTFSLMTLRMLARRRTLWGILIVIFLALVGISSVPSFDVGNQGRFILDFGLFGIEVGALLLALGLASNLYPRDRETRSLMPLLAVPLARWQYLLGRFFGAALVQAAALIVTCLGLMLILLFHELPIPADLLPATLLIIVEGWFLLSTVFFFSFIASPPLNWPLTTMLFVVSQMSVSEFVGIMPSAPGFMRFVRLLLPHADVFHIKDPIAHGFEIEPVYFIIAIFYGLCYAAFMLSLALALFRGRDIK